MANSMMPSTTGGGKGVKQQDVGDRHSYSSALHTK